jgi:hypothetical protein
LNPPRIEFASAAALHGSHDRLHQTNGDRGEICVPYDGNFVILGTPCPLLR